MAEYIESLQRLAEQFGRLQGVGKKSAMRMAFSVVEMDVSDALAFASAIIDARKMIVDGAVGMVEMALERLNENNVVELDEERKAAMVSNLLVVLCGNHDAQPVVNSGSLY
jgi:recombinational DNA repair protein RecR